MTTSMVATLASAVALALLTAASAVAQGTAPARVVLPTDRTALPIPEPVTEVDARKATLPPRFEVKAPAGAPNVLIVLIDDMGFGQSSAFGGPVQWSGWRTRASGTTSSTRRRSAHRPARRCSADATIT